MRKNLTMILGALLILLPAGSLVAGSGKTLGKNPGKIKGRWLEVHDVEALKGYDSVYIGDVSSDIQWKNPNNEAPLDEQILDEKLHEQLMKRLKESRFFSEVLDEAPDEGAEGHLRIDADLVVEPGSRLARYAVGMGAGKSRSILELHLRDHATGEEVALYHGYGVGTGMGLKIAGGGARKMTQDDIQENTKQFVKLLGQL